MTVDVTTPRTRRAVIAGAIGGTVALAAGALGRPLPAEAADGNTVLVGHTYTASTVTTIDASGSPSADVNALQGIGGMAGCGVVGVNNNDASSGGCYGVYGVSDGGKGVVGESNSGVGLYGMTNNAGSVGTVGRSPGGCGVIGFSGQFWFPASPPKTGVYGYASQDIQAIGVYGQSTAGRGVQGVATSGFGVRAAATTGYGVFATATTGTAGYFRTSGPKVGTALQAIGKVKFDKSVGIATIAAGTSSITVTPGIDLTATSAVVATLQGSAGGTTGVYRVSVNATTDQFTIYLSAKATVAAKVAWHVFG